jgi:hypothetical protein
MFSPIVDLLLMLLKFVVGLLAIITIIGVPVLILEHFRFKRLAKRRAGISICQFVRSFDYRHVDTTIIRAVYEGLQGWTTFGIKQFPVMAADELAKVYGLKDEDLDDFAERVAQTTRRAWSDLENNPLYGKVTTTQDLVLFLNRQPKQPA